MAQAVVLPSLPLAATAAGQSMPEACHQYLQVTFIRSLISSLDLSSSFGCHTETHSQYWMKEDSWMLFLVLRSIVDHISTHVSYLAVSQSQIYFVAARLSRMSNYAFNCPDASTSTWFDHTLHFCWNHQVIPLLISKHFLSRRLFL